MGRHLITCIIEVINIKSQSNYHIRLNSELLQEPPFVKTLATLGDRSFASTQKKPFM